MHVDEQVGASGLVNDVKAHADFTAHVQVGGRRKVAAGGTGGPVEGGCGRFLDDPPHS